MKMNPKDIFFSYDSGEDAILWQMTPFYVSFLQFGYETTQFFYILCEFFLNLAKFGSRKAT